jgi:hypothetical protein
MAAARDPGGLPIFQTIQQIPNLYHDSEAEVIVMAITT